MSATTDIVLFGTGGAAQTVAFHLAAQPGLRIVGHTVDAAWRTADSHDGRPLVAWEDLETHFPPDQVTLFGPFSFARMNTLRRDRYLDGKARGYRFASFIHPASHVHATHVGENCLILDACVVQPFATIGDNVMVWPMTAIGHHARIGEHCFLSAQVMVAGHVDIGPECYLSGQVGVAERRRIGRECAILNGAFVTRDLPDRAVVSGPGARLYRYPSTRLHRLI